MHIVNNRKRIIYPSQYLPFKIPFNSASFVSHLLPVSLSTALRALHVWTEKWIFTILLMAEYVAKMRKMRSKCEEMIVNATFAH